jgi:hypothetical protein
MLAWVRDEGRGVAAASGNQRQHAESNRCAAISPYRENHGIAENRALGRPPQWEPGPGWWRRVPMEERL